MPGWPTHGQLHNGFPTGCTGDVDESRGTTSIGGVALPASVALPRATSGTLNACRAAPGSRPLTARGDGSSSRSGHATRIQAFDNWQPLIVHPSGIKPGDWLSDIGTFRQVASVDALSMQGGHGMIHILHFRPQPGVAHTALGFSTQADDVVVWRAATPEVTGVDAGQPEEPPMSSVLPTHERTNP